MKGIDEGVLRRTERDRIVKRVYVGECAGSCSVGRPRKRWIYAKNNIFILYGLIWQ